MKSSMAFKGFFKGLTFLQFCSSVYFLQLLCSGQVVLLYAGILMIGNIDYFLYCPQKGTGEVLLLLLPIFSYTNLYYLRTLDRQTGVRHLLLRTPL